MKRCVSGRNIVCYVNLLGLERGFLAIIFGWLALRRDPLPLLREHRGFAQAGVALGIILLVLVPSVLLPNLHRIRAALDAITKAVGK
ncbi:MAG: hypothetical protein WB992_02525 [Bryobacteraceae bacterium]